MKKSFPSNSIGVLHSKIAESGTYIINQISTNLYILYIVIYRVTYHMQFGVVRMRVLYHWVIAGSVVGDEKCPSSVITPVLITSVQHIGVEEESVSWFHLYLHQRKYLMAQSCRVYGG